MNTEYFATPWNIHYRVDSTEGFNNESSTKIAYSIITNKFEEKLNKLYEGGSALITNTLKEIPAGRYIDSVGRENCCVTVTFKSNEECYNLKQDEMLSIIGNLFDAIISIMDKWNIDEFKPNTFYPLYKSGTRYKPDSMYGLISDVGVFYDRKRSYYNIIFIDDVYKEYIASQNKYFRYIMSKIMKADRVAFFDNQSTIVVIDGNPGTGPTFDRANVLACAAMFAVDTIINTTNLMKGDL